MRSLREYNFRKLVACGPEESAYSAVGLMEDRNVGCVIVIEDSNLLGIVTRYDFIHGLIVKNRDPKRTRISNIMHASPVVVNSSLSVTDALKIMVEKRVERLVVRSGERGKILGVISMEDVVASLSNESFLLSLSNSKYNVILDMVKRLTPIFLARYDGEEREEMERDMNDELKALLRLLEEAEISLRT